MLPDIFVKNAYKNEKKEWWIKGSSWIKKCLLQGKSLNPKTANKNYKILIALMRRHQKKINKSLREKIKLMRPQICKFKM